MAKNLTQIPLETTAPNGGLLYYGTPDGGNPYGYADRVITKTNYLKEVNALVSTNTSNISSVTTRVTTLENLISKTRFSSRTSTFNFTQAANSCISDIYFFGTGTVKVGTTSGGDEILTSRLISGNYRGAEALARYSATSRTIYITLTGASVDIVIISKLNLNT